MFLISRHKSHRANYRESTGT